MTQQSIRVRLFGPPAITSRGTPVLLTRGSTSLLAFLLLGPKGRRPRSTIAAKFGWECPDNSARRRLNTALWRLRSEMRAGTGCDLIVSHGSSHVGTNCDGEIIVDVTEFEGTVAPKLRGPADRMTEQDIEELQNAISLCDGELIEGSCDEWVLDERARLAEMYVSAMTRLVEWFSGRGRWDEVEHYAQRILALEPLREDIHRLLIAAHGAAGRTALATRQFEACRRLLAAQLGLDPMPETVALHMRVIQAPTVHRPLANVSTVIEELQNARLEAVRLGELIDRSLAALRSL